MLLFGVGAIASNAFILDRLDWIDVGDPNYIREAKPSDSHYVLRRYCCGGATGDHGMVQFFYGTDRPFAEIREHYEREMDGLGYHASRVSAWLTEEDAVRFSRMSESDLDCFSIVPFADDYDVAQGLAYRGDPDDLRAELAEFRHPYVLQYYTTCGG